jgi:hypothetical protein
VAVAENGLEIKSWKTTSGSIRFVNLVTQGKEEAYEKNRSLRIS